jgi:sarcosine oxidase subunit gamma
MPEQARRVTTEVAGSDWLRALPPATRFILHGDAEARRRAATVWGIAGSEDPLRAEVAADRASLWLGPDEYLLIDSGAAAGSDAHAADLALRLEAAMGTVPHALVDVSHRQTAIEVHGLHAAAILNGACPLDLDISRCPVGYCTRTVFAKADIVLWRTGEQSFHVEVWRSFSDYVTGLLAVIAQDYYPGP